MTENQKANVDYIPTDTFVDVLVDVLTESVGGKLYERWKMSSTKWNPALRNRVSPAFAPKFNCLAPVLTNCAT